MDIPVADWVLQTTTTVGTGTITLSLPAPGYTDLQDAIKASGDVWYSLLSSNGDRECGIGYFDYDTNTLQRTTIHATLKSGKHSNVSPTPIELKGQSLVSCTFNAESWKQFITDVQVGDAYSLPSTSDPEVTNTGTHSVPILNFGIPKGDKGDKGDAATIEIASTVTGNPGTPAGVTNEGDTHNAVLKFTIPGSVEVSVGSTTTLDPGSQATVVDGNTDLDKVVLNFGIPRGDPGLNGIGAVVDTVSALRDLADPETVLTAQTLGCAAAGDGGGGVWYWDANSSAADNTGTVTLPTGHVGNGRWVRVYDGSTVNVRWFGAFGNGDVDESSAIQLAVDCGAKRVKAPAGTYLIHETITIPRHVSLEGDGLTATLFDGSGTTYSSLTGGCHFTTQGGSLVDIGSLASDVSKGDRTLTFTSPPELAVGDVIVIYNPADYSFSGFRSYYRAGEMVRVAKISGSTVTIQSTLCDSYVAADVDVYKIDGAASHKFQDFSIKGLAGTGGAVTGLKINHGVDVSIENVRVTRCSYGQIFLHKCFNTSLVAAICEEDFTANYGTDYGLVIGNSQQVNVVGGYYSAARHGITTGGGTAVGDVPCRYVYVQGATVSTTGDSQAANFHGNAEYAWFDNCVLDGGFAGGGDNIKITNNQIKGKTTNGELLVYIAEMRGANFTVRDNTIWSNYLSTGSSRGVFVDVGGNTASMTDDTFKGGVIDISGNIMIWAAQAASEECAPIKVINRGYAGSEPIEVRISSNTIRTVYDVRYGAIEVSVVDATGLSRPWDCVSLTDNSFYGCGGLYLRNTHASRYATKKLVINNNVIEGPYMATIFATGVEQYACIKGNHLARSRFWPVYVGGKSGMNCRHVNVSDNVVVDNMTSMTSSSSTNADIIVNYADYAHVADNSASSMNEYIAVSATTGFLIGETITGSTSGATATVLDVSASGSARLMIERTRTGTFSAGETITGSISNSTTTVVSVAAYTRGYKTSYTGISNLHDSNNHDIRASNNYQSGVTAYLSGCLLTGSATYNPPSLVDGASVTTTVTVTGAALGDYVSASFSNDLQGISMVASVSASNTVTVVFRNNTGTEIDLASGTLRVRVTKV